MKQPVFFVTGTDTDVGKTFVASLLVYKWNADYWKPVQTGIESEMADSTTIANLSPDKCWTPKIFLPTYQLQKPLSPYEAMSFETGIDIELENFEIPEQSNQQPLVVEGAGGVAVPLTRKKETITDLIRTLASKCDRPFYIIVVARGVLGTLNHTFLTLNYLHANGLGDNVLGVVVNGEQDKSNIKVLKEFGMKILATVDKHTTLSEALVNFPSFCSLDL